MVARAKSLGVNARLARAEALQFKRGWFDAAVVRMSLHLLDRPQALGEVARILSPAGRATIATEDPAHFDEVRGAPLVPVRAQKRSRALPDVDTLTGKGAGAGPPRRRAHRAARGNTRAIWRPPGSTW